MIVYRIRRKSDGLFSAGGSCPSFSKNGKIWKQKGHLTNHLNLADTNWLTRDGKTVYSDCELVSYELTELEIDSIPLSQYIADRDNARLQRANDRDLAIVRRAGIERRRQYEELKKEFE